VSDPTRLRQILINLLSNAAKFTEGGSVRLEVERTGGAFRFRVADTGIGMNEEQLARVFEPFQQADTSTTRKHGGTGLGLTISSRLCRLLGGVLQAESRPGEGSTFTATLPVVPPGR
jgi:signal transduction histidine kinase